MEIPSQLVHYRKEAAVAELKAAQLLTSTATARLLERSSQGLNAVIMHAAPQLEAVSGAYARLLQFAPSKQGTVIGFALRQAADGVRGIEGAARTAAAAGRALEDADMDLFGAPLAAARDAVRGALASLDVPLHDLA